MEKDFTYIEDTISPIKKKITKIKIYIKRLQYKRAFQSCFCQNFRSSNLRVLFWGILLLLPWLMILAKVLIIDWVTSVSLSYFFISIICFFASLSHLLFVESTGPIIPLLTEEKLLRVLPFGILDSISLSSTLREAIV